MKREIRECDLCGQEENIAVHVTDIFGTDICSKCFPESLWQEYFDLKERVSELKNKFISDIKARVWVQDTTK